MLLLGTSLFVHFAFPSAALAQNECGAPPPGGGTITCPPGAYPGGISYTAQPADLTVVLPPGVNAGDTVELTASAAGVDFRLDGAAGATVVTSGANANGIFVSSTNGSARITSTSVTTTGNNSRGIDALAARDIAIASDRVVTTGNRGFGIFATSNVGTVQITSLSMTTAGTESYGITALSAGNIAIVSDTLRTSGNNSLGIFALSTGPFPLPISGTARITVASTSITTTGAQSGGIVVRAPGNVTVTSGTVDTTGSGSNGISANSDNGAVIITSTRVTTAGQHTTAIHGSGVGVGGVTITSGIVSASGFGATGIIARSRRGNVVVTSGAVSAARGILAIAEDGNVVITSGTLAAAGGPVDYQRGGIYAKTYNVGTVTVASTSLTTSGAEADGIRVLAGGSANVTSGTVATTGSGAEGIVAQSGSGNVVVTSGTVTTAGADSTAISGAAEDGNVTVNSGSVTTQGSNSIGINANAGLDATVTSGTVHTTGNNSTGIFASAEHGNLTVTSGSATTQGGNSIAINAFAENDITVTSGSVSTVGPNSTGIFGQSLDGDVIVTSGSVSAAGPNSTGIFGLARDGDVIVTSGSASTAGPDSTGVLAWSLNGDVIVTSGSVSTAGLNSPGISALSNGGDATIISTGPVIANGWGIHINAHGGNATSTSTDVTTSGAISSGILVSASSVTGSATVTSTGTVRTSGGPFSDGINVSAPDRVVITSATVITTGTNSTGIRGSELRGGGSGGVSITSGSVTTSGSFSPAINGFASNGDVEIFSTGTVTTTGFSSAGIVAVSNAGSANVDANAVSVTGTGGVPGISVGSRTTSTVTIRGLVHSTNGFEVAAGGAATVNTTTTGIIRGAVDLDNNADRVNNAGLFDAIGTSLFRAGSDVFNNSGTIRSANGAAVLDALETFNNGGRVEMRDDDAGDTLNVTGAFIGSGASRLGVDANLAANQADVLITGAATGSTILDVNLLGTAVLNLTGTLVVDGGAGTSATAFTVTGGVQSNPYVALGLLFDAPNNNFLLVGLPGQPAFETAVQAEMIGNFWSHGTDAVSAQLEAARDGGGAPAGGNLTGGGGLGGWVQLLSGRIERDASQAFAGGGGTSLFDTSYEQDFEGVQGGLDYQSGGTILGISFGAGRSDATFEQSFNRVDLDGYNAGAYAAFNAGGFFFSAIGKVDWVEAEARPGAGVPAAFDATAWGLRGTAGYRFAMGKFYLEPSASLSWVNVDIDDYVSNGATIAFDDYRSLRGAAGVRFGGAFRSGNGIWSPFVGIFAIDEFEGDARNTFTLGQTIGLQQDAPGTFGELAAGLTYATGRLEAFVRGEVDFGGEREGLSGRAGARLRF